jgi:penicillin-binding protein 1A
LEDRDPRRSGKKRGKSLAKPGGGGSGGSSGARGRRGAGARGGSRGAAGGGLFSVLRAVLWMGLSCVLLGIAGLVGMFSYYGSDPNLPTLKALGDYHPKQVTRVLDRNGAVIGELGAEKRTVVPFASIPKVLINAVVAAEDADYFNHAGLDYRGMARAFIENVIRGRTAQGGSTITQQVVKTFLLSPERTMRRKVQEIILARKLSQKFTKEEVLALYLNQIYYGHGRYGCEEAARYFFGKSVRDINVAEAALLAGLPQSPERLSPRKHPEAAKTRQRYVLGRLAENGFITPAMAAKLAAEPIRLARETSAQRGVAAEAIDSVGRFLSDKYGERNAYELGTTVETTIDARMQEQARESLERGLEELDARQGFRGPSGHLAGKALDRRRAELKAAHDGGRRESAIFEGIVDRVDKVDKIEKPEKSAGARSAADAKNGPAKDPKLGKLIVDIGGEEGVVDLSLEPRYTRGSKPLLDRFTPGDLVRVRTAIERGRSEGSPMPLALELGPQAAMVVLDPASRRILALVGGYEFHPGGLDRSRSAHRQPGSAFKPIYYSAAIEARKITAASIINDSPEVYSLWKPQNYEKEFRGPVRVRTALAHSINTVSIKVLSDVGIPAARDTATRFGLNLPPADKLDLSMALGSIEVTPLELANAYAVFPGGGTHVESLLIRGVGAEKIEPKPPEPAIKAEVAYIMVSLLRSVIDEGTAHAAAGKLRRPAAGKTGTTNSQKDAWFVGFTPDLLAAVWVGFDDGKVLGRGEAGAKTALPIWIDFMSKSLMGRPTKDFIAPPGVVIQRIDQTTGLLPAAGQDTNTIDEVFLADTVPTEQAPAAGEESSADKLLLDQQ